MITIPIQRQPAAQTLHSFAHAAHAEAHGRVQQQVGETDAVIDYSQVGTFALAIQANLHLIGLGVFFNIGQGFLGHSPERLCYSRSQLGGSLGYLTGYLQTSALAKLHA